MCAPVGFMRIAMLSKWSSAEALLDFLPYVCHEVVPSVL